MSETSIHVEGMARQESTTESVIPGANSKSDVVYHEVSDEEDDMQGQREEATNNNISTRNTSEVISEEDNEEGTPLASAQALNAKQKVIIDQGKINLFFNFFDS